MLYRQPKTPHVRRMGPFAIRRIFPGASVPGHDDHGYAALAAVDDAVTDRIERQVRECAARFRPSSLRIVHALDCSGRDFDVAVGLE